MRWFNFFQGLSPNKWGVIGVMLVAMISLMGCQRDMAPYRSLIANSVKTQAVVLSKHCKNHGAFRYWYKVEGVSYTKYVAELGVDCDNLKVGGVIDVFYDKNNPDFSSVVDPARLYERNEGYYFPSWAWYGLLLVIPLFKWFQNLRVKPKL